MAMLEGEKEIIMVSLIYAAIVFISVIFFGFRYYSDKDILPAMIQVNVCGYVNLAVGLAYYIVKYHQ
jgi:hypothetical protein